MDTSGGLRQPSSDAASTLTKQDYSQFLGTVLVSISGTPALMFSAGITERAFPKCSLPDRSILIQMQVAPVRVAVFKFERHGR
jgi:hypothetical protein